jgi:hypothetical protein
MKIKQLKVLSGISKIVYHRTYDRPMSKILISDKFYLSSAEATDAENKLGPGVYYLSTARTRYGRYTDGNVIITLDGQKLSYKYKGKALDYWEGMGTDPKREQEDRIYSPKKEINNASKYILKVDINVKNIRNSSSLIKIVTLCKRNKIPVNLFDSEKKLQLGNSKYALDTLEFIKSLPMAKKSKYDSQTPYSAKHLIGWYRYIVALENFLKLDYSKVFSDTVTPDIVSYHKNSDSGLKGSISADMHNGQGDKNATMVTLFDKLKRLARHRGYILKDLHKYILELRDKVRIKDREVTDIENLKKYLNYIVVLRKRETNKLDSFGWLHKNDANQLYYVDSTIKDYLHSDNKIAKNLANELRKEIKLTGADAYDLAIGRLRREL